MVQETRGNVCSVQSDQDRQSKRHHTVVGPAPRIVESAPTSAHVRPLTNELSIYGPNGPGFSVAPQANTAAAPLPAPIRLIAAIDQAACAGAGAYADADAGAGSTHLAVPVAQASAAVVNDQAQFQGYGLPQAQNGGDVSIGLLPPVPLDPDFTHLVFDDPMQASPFDQHLGADSIGIHMDYWDLLSLGNQVFDPQSASL